jgi:NADPH:quinone reductase-like Zn-dependent oxidoreductase
MTMRAAIYEKYGPPEVVTIANVPKPDPKDDEVLIRARATTVTSGDFRCRSLTVPTGFGWMTRLALGVSGPRQKILGSEVAGDVEAVGKNVRAFKVGDPVVACSDTKMGCHAEYVCLPEAGTLAHKPDNLSFAQAAALSFGGTTALHFFRKGKLQPGEKVLVNGASGSVGTACVQLAKHFGAEVTGVSSTGNLELVRSLGADHVIDHTREDFSQGAARYDIVVDTVGTAPFARSKRVLAKGGRLLLVFGTLPEMLRAPFAAFAGKKVVGGIALGNPEYLRELAALAQAGKFTPVIDREYPLEQIVEAHRYVELGHKKGNVVVTL